MLYISLLLTSIAAAVGSRYYYIYDWPKEYSDVYPAPGAELDKDSPYDHGFYHNNGAGKLLIPEMGLFQTWQFSLYKNAISRLFHSKYRTRDPTKATAFILPFDAGVHSYIDHINGKKRLASPHAWSVRAILQHIASNSTLASIFWKNRGHDHFVFFSTTSFVMTGIGVKEFWTDICQNCTALTLETTPTLTSTSYHRSRKYWYASPYPSSYHWYEQIPRLPWSVLQGFVIGSGDIVATSRWITPDVDQVPSSSSVLSTASLPNVRDIFVLIIGSVKTLNPRANVVRRRLHEQCLAAAEEKPDSGAGVGRRRFLTSVDNSSDLTKSGVMEHSRKLQEILENQLLQLYGDKFLRKRKKKRSKGKAKDFSTVLAGSTKDKMDNSIKVSINDISRIGGKTSQPLCQWHHAKHSCNALASLTEQMALFRRAVFCPAPPGDTVTRKSLFDSLVSGCIPVIFAKASLSQYVWFLSLEEIDEVAVYIPLQDIIPANQRAGTGPSAVDFMSILKTIGPDVIARKQQAIAKIASRLQYSIVPQRVMEDSTSVWDPPMEDATSVLISRILDPGTVFPSAGFTDEELRYQKCLQHELMRSHDNYGGLYAGGTAHLGGAAGNVFRKLQCELIDFSKLNLSEPCFRKGANMFVTRTDVMPLQ